MSLQDVVITEQTVLELQRLKKSGYDFASAIASVAEEYFTFPPPAQELYKIAFDFSDNPRDALTRIQAKQRLGTALPTASRAGVGLPPTPGASRGSLSSVSPSTRSLPSSPSSSPSSSLSSVSSSSSSGSSVVTLDRLVIVLHFYSREAAEMCKEEEARVVQAVAVLTRDVVKMTSDRDVEHNLVPLLQIKDDFGQVEFDLLWGEMRMVARLPGDQVFPLQWKTNKSTTRFEIQKINVDTSASASGGGGGGSSLVGGGGEDLGLEQWVMNVAVKAGKKQAIDTWMAALKKQDIDSIADLQKWTHDDWRGFNQLSITARNLLQESLKSLSAGGGGKKVGQAKRPSPAETPANVFKIKRYLYFLTGQIDELPWLNLETVALGFKEIGEIYKDELLLAKMYSFYESYTVKKMKFLKMDRGLLLYGPPGTGKTLITEMLAKKIGFTEVVMPLASTEVNRPHVGETERILLALSGRAWKLPHLLCSIAIDEIDALVPKRNQNTSEHKVDALSVLLAVIGGIKDVPNLVILGSTNRLNMIDDAFSRRMSGKFFVGRPGPDVRRNMLDELKDVKFKLKAEIIDLLVILTVNFSGAALSKLRSDLLVHWKQHGFKSMEEFVRCIDMVAEEFNIRVGSYFVPSLYDWKSYAPGGSGSGNGSGSSSPTLIDTQLKGLEKVGPTGCVLIDLESRIFQVECQNGKLHEITLSEAVKSTADILPALVNFSIERKIEFLQLFDLELLLANAAFDDNTAMECLTERFVECHSYSRSMMIFDIESLVGVNEHESQSNLGPSLSYSLNNQRLWSFTLECARKSVFKPNINKEIWIVVISTRDFLTRQYKMAMSFPETAAEKDSREREETLRTEEKLCLKCTQTYVQAENSLNCCSYHDGFLVNTSKPMSSWLPKKYEDILTDTANSQYYKYICCFHDFGSAGCKKSKHDSTKDGKNNQFYLNFLIKNQKK